MIHLICGKICSGKSHYAKGLAAEENAVILSCDELTLGLFPEGLGERHDFMMQRVQAYLREKAADIACAGGKVILEWGFWKRSDRAEITKYFSARGIPVQWHYMDVSEDVLLKSIARRNHDVCSGTDSSFYVDDGLFMKMESLFEAPDESECIDWNIVERKFFY